MDKDRRSKHNQSIIDRMRHGEPTSSFDAMSSWFPPRPIVEKDKAAIKKLYGDSIQDKSPVSSDN